MAPIGTHLVGEHTMVGEIKTPINPDSTGLDSLWFLVHVD